MLNTPHGLTPAELARLARVRATPADTQPFVHVTYTAVPTNGRAGAAFATSRTIIPWRIAMELDDE